MSVISNEKNEALAYEDSEINKAPKVLSLLDGNEATSAYLTHEWRTFQQSSQCDCKMG